MLPSFKIQRKNAYKNKQLREREKNELKRSESEQLIVLYMIVQCDPGSFLR